MRSSEGKIDASRRGMVFALAPLILYVLGLLNFVFWTGKLFVSPTLGPYSDAVPALGGTASLTIAGLLIAVPVLRSRVRPKWPALIGVLLNGALFALILVLACMPAGSELHRELQKFYARYSVSG